MHLTKLKYHTEKGGLRAGLLLWLIGVPLPVILIISLLRGCH